MHSRVHVAPYSFLSITTLRLGGLSLTVQKGHLDAWPDGFHHSLHVFLHFPTIGRAEGCVDVQMLQVPVPLEDRAGRQGTRELPEDLAVVTDLGDCLHLHRVISHPHPRVRTLIAADHVHREGEWTPLDIHLVAGPQNCEDEAPAGNCDHIHAF
jgi:hypothetical protein